MHPNQVKNAADACAIVSERELTHVKVGVFDVDGILRGKYMSRAKFEYALETGSASAMSCSAGIAGDPSTGTNPLPMTGRDFEQLYRNCIGGNL